MRMNTQRILAALLSLVLLLALAPAGWADGEDTGGETPEVEPACYVQVIPGGDSVIEDLKTANIVVDVYKVAVMTKSKTYDTYEFTATTAFAGSDDGTIVALVNDIQNRLEDSEIDKEKWDLLAEGALQAVKANPGTIIKSNTYEADANGVVALTGITQGLYLVVAHTKDLEDYLRTIEAGETYTYLDPNNTEHTVSDTYPRTVSIAQTKLYEYFYTAQVIAIPTKDPYPDENGERNTANPGPWIFGTPEKPLTYVLKPGRVSRFGDLKIVKTLNTFAGPDPASFVFEIKWNDGTKDEIRYAEITFTDSGTREYVLEKVIPVGAQVAVTEEHSGLQYSLKSSAETATIAAEEEITAGNAQLATVSFTNDHTGPGGGYGVTNRFTAEKDGTAEDKATYQWEKKPDSGSNQSGASAE